MWTAHDIQADERERCARIAETVPVLAEEHPAVYVTALSTARRVIAAAIRADVAPAPAENHERRYPGETPPRGGPAA